MIEWTDARFCLPSLWPTPGLREFSLPAVRNAVAFDLSRVTFALVGVDDVEIGNAARKRCLNKTLAACNWLAPAGQIFCPSCALTRTRPSDGDTAALVEFALAEAAKRRLVVELTELGLRFGIGPMIPTTVWPSTCCPVRPSQSSPATPTESSRWIWPRVTTSTANSCGWEMDEPYRTLLGHFRHEIGHYYFVVLAETGPARSKFERLFGDPDLDYQAALDRHYSDGAPAGWQNEFVSSYATMHPAEDWAETFAHYLHIRDTLDTAAAFGQAPAAATLRSRLPGRVGFDRIMQLWVPMTWSLNMLNRSMGHPDLYPFVLAPAVLDKMALVHELIDG